MRKLRREHGQVSSFRFTPTAPNASAQRRRLNVDIFAVELCARHYHIVLRGCLLHPHAPLRRANLFCARGSCA